MPYRVVSADDERPARAKIARLLASDPRFELCGEAANGSEAVEVVAATGPDILILDVQMPVLDGFGVVSALGPARRCALVFSTAYEEHALRAFDAHAVDYLLKPFDKGRFAAAMVKAVALVEGGRVLPRWEAPDRLARDQTRGRMTLPVGPGTWVTVDASSILRVSAAGKYVCVVTRDETHVVREAFQVFARRLDGDEFVMVRRGEIVRLDAVARVSPLEHGDASLTLVDGAEIRVSRTLRRNLLSRYLGGAG